MAIRLYFQIFNANQLFSPILGEYKNTKTRLTQLSLQLSSQLNNLPRIPSNKLPIPITFTFIINKKHYEPICFFLLAHRILDSLRNNVIIQDINESCVSQITIKYKTTENITHEGCIIDFTD